MRWAGSSGYGQCLIDDGQSPPDRHHFWALPLHHLVDGRNSGRRPAAKTSYFEKLSHLNLIPSKAVNRALGIEQFKWVVKNSFFRFLNQSIRVEGKRTDLASVRHQMTLAEINHLIGFLFVAAAAWYQSFNVSFVFGLGMIIPNVILNAYPSLLQQENKRRIDQLLNRQPRHNEDAALA